MKQVLSVADFATILNLVTREIDKIEYREEAWGLDEEDYKRRQKQLDEVREEQMKSPYYLSLKHLKESLENLNVEVETADVKIEKFSGGQKIRGDK